MADQSDARAARRARRSLCSARIWSGVETKLAAQLESDDDTFFGSDIDVDSEAESPPSSPPAKRPRLEESWSESEDELSSSDTSSGDVDGSDSDAEPGAEEGVAADALAGGCGCEAIDHFTSVAADDVKFLRKQFRGAPQKSKDTFILGALSSGIFVDDAPHGGAGPRRRIKFRYVVFGHTVCRKAFSVIYKVGSTRLKRLQKLAGQKACFPELHGNAGGVTWNVSSPEMRERVAEFIRNYASVNGLPMPAAPRGRANNAPTYLPASESFSSVHIDYCTAQEGDEMVSLSTFKRIWKTHHPDLRFMKPREDVCARCENYRNNLRHSLSDHDKRKVTKEWLAHIDLAKSEREFYNDCIRRAKEEPDALTHVTFDFSENFVLPQHSRQPGPVYFKVLFRVNDFGVINEAIPEQVHFLFHEGQTIGPNNGKGHGPNAVISMLHHYLDEHPHAPSLHGHCDNCCGQNKNKSVMAYLCWRIMAGFEEDIKLSFMIVGHTRCSVDGGFGLAKKKYRSADCDSPAQLESTIESSATQNKVDYFSWKWMDWDTFLSQKFKKIVGITKFQHFHFSREFPGVVKMKESIDSEEVSLKLFKGDEETVDHHEMPNELPAGGLSEDRRKYLIDNVMEFCRPENRDAFRAALD